MSNADELLASSSSTAQVSESEALPDGLPERTDPSINLGKHTGLPASGAGTSSSGNGGAPSVVYIACEQLAASDAGLVVWLTHSRFVFRQTLLPGGLFRPPRVSS